MSRHQPGKSSFLSEEYVHDSDDEDEQVGDVAVSSGLIDDHTADESGQSDDNASGDETSKAAASPNSDEDSNADGSDTSKNGASKDDSEKVGDHTDEDGEKDDDSDNGGLTTSGNSSKRGRDNTGREHDQQAKRQKSSESSMRASSKQFTPPSGFAPLVLGASDFASDTAEIFANLNEKQVWHITAPASLNIASIKELDLEAAMQGKAILTENGISYSMQETNPQHETLMLTKDTSAGYEPSKMKVSKSFNLGVRSGSRNKAPPTKGSDHDSPPEAVTQFVALNSGQRESPRQQPEGLHMQYQPFGSENRRRQVAIMPFSASKTSLKNSGTASPAKAMDGEDWFIADPMLAITKSSTKNSQYTPRPLIFTTPIMPDEELDMEDAPSPSKTAAKDKKASISPSSRSIKKTKVDDSALGNGSDPKAKKKRKSKLVDGGGL